MQLHKPRGQAMRAFKVPSLALTVVAAIFSLSSATQSLASGNKELSKRIVVVGELHGSEQAPAALGQFVQHAMASGEHVAIGIEAPACLLTEYFPPARVIQLDGDRGPTCDRGALADGRFNKSLLGSVHAALESSPAVSVFALEDARGKAYEGKAWDPSRWERRAAERIGSIAERTHVVALTGNLHGRRASYDHDGRPVTTFVMLLGPRATNVTIDSAQDGSVFACFETCKVQQVRASAKGGGTGLNCGAATPGYDCQLVVDRYSAANLLSDNKMVQREAEK